MIQGTQAPPEIIPAEVLAFAAQQGVTKHLPIVVAMTRRIFPNGPVSTLVEEDPEIADDRHIVLEARADGLDVAKALEARYQWHRELFSVCPAPLVCVFRLGLEMNS